MYVGIIKQANDWICPKHDFRTAKKQVFSLSILHKKWWIWPKDILNYLIMVVDRTTKVGLFNVSFAYY